MRQKKQLDIHIKSYGKEDIALKKTSLMDFWMLSLALQLSMDGPNHHVLRDHNTVLNIGSCSFHVLHNDFKTGCSTTGWDIQEILGFLREDHQSTTGSSDITLKFVSHTWQENLPVTEKALVIPKLKCFVENVDKVRKHNLHRLIPLKLKVFISVSKLWQPFLTAYETDKPMFFFLSEDLRKILVFVPQRFDGQLFNVEHQCIITDVDLGYAVEKEVEALIASNVVQGDILEARVSCRRLLVSLAEKLLQKSPVTYS
ncbi:hypothetical protein PR048_005407, partial [Dryococelus australis]